MPSSTCSSSSSSPSYSSVLKSRPGSSSRSSSISRSSITSCSSSSYSSLSSSTTSSSSFSPKSHLTVHDLYMRYAPLKSLTSTKSTTPQVSPPRVLPPMTLQDLLNKFAPKLSATPLDPPSSAKTASPQSPPQPLEMKTSPAKTPASTVDKEGRDVTKAGMKNTASKPSPVYKRWCTFRRWPQRSLPLITPLSLAKVGFRHIPGPDNPDLITCDECKSGEWCNFKRQETAEDQQCLHKESCSFYKPSKDNW